MSLSRTNRSICSTLTLMPRLPTAQKALGSGIGPATMKVPNPTSSLLQQGTSAWLNGRGLRFSVYDRQADHLQFPWLSLVDSPSRLPPHEPSEPARTRLQGEGEHQHTDGAGDQQPDRPVQSRHRCYRPHPETATNWCARQGGIPRLPDCLPSLCL